MNDVKNKHEGLKEAGHGDRRCGMNKPIDIALVDLKTPEGILEWAGSQHTDNGPNAHNRAIAAYIAEQLARIDALQTENTRLVLKNRELKERISRVVFGDSRMSALSEPPKEGRPMRLSERPQPLPLSERTQPLSCACTGLDSGTSCCSEDTVWKRLKETK